MPCVERLPPPAADLLGCAEIDVGGVLEEFGEVDRRKAFVFEETVEHRLLHAHNRTQMALTQRDKQRMLGGCLEPVSHQSRASNTDF